MKIVIFNSVPLNGGDEALLRATLLGLNTRYPDAEVSVLCSQLAKCREHLPDIKLLGDLHVALRGKVPMWPFVSNLKLQFLNKFSADSFFWSAEEKESMKVLLEADLILSAPGGYLHDFYFLSSRLTILEWLADMGKDVVIFAQSVGPFWKNSTKKRMKALLPKMKAVLVRESFSAAHLDEIGLDSANYTVTADAAWLWRDYARELYREHTASTHKIAICIRNWPTENDQIEQTISKTIALVEHLLKSNQSREVTFLSTCQGIEDYIDDSIHGEKVRNGISDSLKSRCSVIKERLTPRDLISRYSTFDAYIGMRLHGAILSMLGGTPAMNLGYEDKTKGIYKQMSLTDFQIDYDASAEDWISCADNFLVSLPEINATLAEKLDEMLERSRLNLQHI